MKTTFSALALAAALIAGAGAASAAPSLDSPFTYETVFEGGNG
ncbi:hypothetical protein BMS3Bbin10_00972 [bacterium BMS3Bbin10]|nr:hypothetical protein BMS3Bbin10_00972 [bacterium BMS3Bbin10]